MRDNGDRLFLVFVIAAGESMNFRVVIEFNMHYRDQSDQFMSLIPLTHYSDVARVFFSAEDFEMWDKICQGNMQHSHQDILEYNHELMLKQNRLFEALQARLLIDVHKRDEQADSNLVDDAIEKQLIMNMRLLYSDAVHFSICLAHWRALCTILSSLLSAHLLDLHIDPI